MQAQQREAIYHQVIDAINRNDAAALDRFLAEELVSITIPSRANRPVGPALKNGWLPLEPVSLILTAQLMRPSPPGRIV